MSLASTSERAIRSVFFLFATLGLVPGAQAQEPSAWAQLSPPGGVNPARLQASDKLVLYRDGTYLRVFSAATGRWHAHTPSFGTTPILRDDILMIPEYDRWTAFSAYRGVFDVLFVNWAATTPLFADSVVCVRDGGTVHAFSAFTGRWHTHAVPSDWTAAVQNRIAVFGDTRNPTCDGVTAFDVYTGQWHDLLPTQGGRLQRFVVAGSTVVLDFTIDQLGFSGLHPTWVSSGAPANFPRTGVPYRDTDLVNSRDTFFSGVTGTMSVFADPPRGTFTQRGHVGTLSTVSREYACGIAHNAWTPLPAGARLVGGYDAAVCLYELDDQMFGFSAVTNQIDTVAMTLGFPGVVEVVGSVGAAVDTLSGVPALFSALTGRWHIAPPEVLPGLPTVARTGALLATPSGLHAFSARTGAFVPLAGSGLTTSTPLRGNALVAWDADTLFAFDATTDRWLSTPMRLTPGAQPSFGVSTALIVDPVRAAAFAAGSGRLESTPLPEPVLAQAAQGNVAYVYTASHVLAFAGLPEVTTWMGFPEGDVAVGIGRTFRYQLRAPQGSIALLGLGLRSAVPISLPSLGDLWLDPRFAVFSPVAPQAGEERVVQAVSIPLVPSLRNSELFLQAAVAPAAGALYLTDPVPFRIL